MTSALLGYDHTLTDYGVIWTKRLDDTQTASVQFRDIRRERTGVHALVLIGLDGTLLSQDVFNIGRGEERTKLVKAAQFQLSDVEKTAWPDKVMRHEIDILALQTVSVWEEERIQIVEYGDEDAPVGVGFILKPFIIVGGGTFLYGPPGAAKSYTLQSMAVSIGEECDADNPPQADIWDIRKTRDVLYINLERDAASMHRREVAIKRALGVRGPSHVSYLHARGLPLSSVRRQARKWIENRSGRGVVMLDSISRSTEGQSLNDDTTANNLVDMLNGLKAEAWIAIGHSPAGNADKLYGSMHFQAGCDIEVKVTSEARERVVATVLQIDKANDIGRGGLHYVVFEFLDDESPVSVIRRATNGEFPDLGKTKERGRFERIAEAIQELGGTATATELEDVTGFSRPSIFEVLRDTKHFVRLPKTGRDQPYGIRMPDGYYTR